MTMDHAISVLEQAGFTVTRVRFAVAVDPPGVDRWRVLGPDGMSSGLTDEDLCARAERHLPDVEQMTLGET